MRLVNIPSDMWRQEIIRILSRHDATKHVRDVLAAALPNDDGSFSVRLSVEDCDVASPHLSAAGGKGGPVAAVLFMERYDEDPAADHRWNLR
jgi:hypothetical protein